MSGPPVPGHAERVRRLARVMDSAVGIPGTRVRFGLDAVLGLVPGVGDVVGAAAAGYVVLAAARLGAPASVLLRMLVNVGVDTLVGSVPLLGDLFDLGWRSNTRNVALLERHLADPRGARAASRAVVVGVLVGLALLAAAGIFLVVALLRALLALAT
ncbi:DUF4112 domain-containing protein [Roseisolibacter sp. H3M3-2]|uniref:DUF4112 domain-containing protein n=1 Tax=Roseisolibacter sp. H3M3-2 TaxID=3031323 RepID=UPI0023DA5D22|nr:DUF4112 domain-containing protein [Roseisolibacter sp. H3M3-2]MDF1503421.1 DUF4112 domain-containing protein [Roseisolibacter sp. H3M3-2]